MVSLLLVFDVVFESVDAFEWPHSEQQSCAVPIVDTIIAVRELQLLQAGELLSIYRSNFGFTFDTSNRLPIF